MARIDAHVFKLNIAELAQFGDRVMSNFSWDEKVHQAHLFRAYFTFKSFCMHMRTKILTEQAWVVAHWGMKPNWRTTPQ